MECMDINPVAPLSTISHTADLHDIQAYPTVVRNVTQISGMEE
jgi:hypothetical protein